jgi:hypothetical protein
VKIPRWWNLCDSLDLEGVHSDVVLGDDEPMKTSNSEEKYTLESVQADIILSTSLKDDS